MTTVLRRFRLTRLCREYLHGQYFGGALINTLPGQQTMPNRTLPFCEARPSFPTTTLLASYLFIAQPITSRIHKKHHTYHRNHNGSN